MEVSNVPGGGFLEKVYERAMVRELAMRGLGVEQQRTFPVLYKGQCVGEYAADLVVEGRVIVELKCVERLGKEHLAQCLNYLKASGLRDRRPAPKPACNVRIGKRSHADP